MLRVATRFWVQGSRFKVLGSGVQGLAQPPAKKTAGLIENETNEHRKSNVQHRIMYSVYLKKDWAKLLRRNAYEGRKRFHPSSFDTAAVRQAQAPSTSRGARRRLRFDTYSPPWEDSISSGSLVVK
jgi:hypothetical protein